MSAATLLGRVAAILALHEASVQEFRFGYEPDWDHYENRIDGWYCLGPNCGQEQGKAHIAGCPVAAYEEEVRS